MGMTVLKQLSLLQHERVEWMGLFEHQEENLYNDDKNSTAGLISIELDLIERCQHDH